MKEIAEYEKDIASIRMMMERSAKFISLSGLSGILAGSYALLGAWAANALLLYPYAPFGIRLHYDRVKDIMFKLVIIAVLVLTASLVTGLLLSYKKAKKIGTTIWNSASRQLFIDVAIPLATGGVFIILLLVRGFFTMASAACLIFYGLALINGSHSTFKEIRYLGLCEIVMGMVAMMFPSEGLLIWALGFGVLHIVYGALMHYRYDR